MGFGVTQRQTIRLAVPENLTLETNITSIGKNGCEFVAIFI